MKFTPENIDALPDDGVFVFGSNTDGEHCGGAALVALKRFGAVNGQAEGPQGRSYAIPTMGYWYSFSHGTTEVLRYKIRIPFDELVAACDRFLVYASQHPEQTFYVTKNRLRNSKLGSEGCGAGIRRGVRVVLGTAA